MQTWASSSAVSGKKSVSPVTSSGLLSCPAQKQLPQEHTGTVTRQTRQLHLQSLSDLPSAIKVHLFIFCQLPSSPLLQYTPKRLGRKASTWNTFLFPMCFGPPLGCIFSFLCHHLRSCPGKHTWPSAPQNVSNDMTDISHLGLLPPAKPPLGISCL